MDEEERKQKGEGSLKQKGESTVKKAQKTNSVITTIRRILAVPVLRWVFIIGLVAAVIIFVLTGAASFFHSMPNQARDRLTEIMSGTDDW